MELSTLGNNYTVVFDLITEKENAEKTLKKVNKKIAFYKEELKELEAISHKTKDGTMVLISSMEDSHIINLCGVFARQGYDSEDIPEKYLKEIKSRGLIDKVIDRMDKEFKTIEEDEGDRGDFEY